MNEKTVNINNFIGTYDNFIPKEECNKAINIYEQQDKFNNTINRMPLENSSILEKQDQQSPSPSHNIREKNSHQTDADYCYNLVGYMFTFVFRNHSPHQWTQWAAHN